jgi:hypothetical protein
MGWGEVRPLSRRAAAIDTTEDQYSNAHCVALAYTPNAHLRPQAKPKLLVVYHTIGFRPGISPPKSLSSLIGAGPARSTSEVLQEEIGSRYSGQFVIGSDLDV